MSTLDKPPAEMDDQELVERIAELDEEQFPLAERCQELVSEGSS